LTLPFLNLMNQVIYLQKTMEENSFYHCSHPLNLQSYPARVEIQPSQTYGKDGQVLPSYATVYTTAEVDTGDSLILPDGSVRQVISVTKAVDGEGTFSHSVVKV